MLTFCVVMGMSLDCGLLQGLAPLATLTSTYFSFKFVPEVTSGRYTRPEVSEALASTEPGGTWNPKPYA